MKNKEKTLGIYVPSYHRYDSIITDKVLNDCTYVVRESEKDQYVEAGVRKVLAVPDDEIDSFPKVRQWIIDNTPEDIVVQIDDDIKLFAYVNHYNLQAIESKDDIDIEIMRVAQLISDLDIGFASIKMTIDTRQYNQEFLFKSLIGMCCWYNKEAIKKSRYDTENKLKADQDFELQELLYNRIILIPSYIRAKGIYDKNKGGNSTGRDGSAVTAAFDHLKAKWGKYIRIDRKKNVMSIKVKR